MKMNQWLPTVALALICFLSTTTILSAQPHHRGRDKASIETFKAELELSSEQEAQLAKIKAEAKEKMQAFRDQKDGNREDMRAQMRNLREETRTQMEGVLTAAQQSKLKELRQAQREEHQQKRAEAKENRKAMHQEMSSYKVENVLPVLRAQRSKLENEISAEDKATIAELRTAMQEAKAAKKAAHKASRKEGANEGKHKGRRHPMHKEIDSHLGETMRAHKEQVKALVEKYENQIDALFAEIEPQAEEWRKAQKAIAEKYRPLAPEGKPDSAPHGAHFKHRGPGSKVHGHKHASMPRKGAFLLMDPNQPLQQQLEEYQEAPATVEQLTLYPNPARSSGTFAFDVLEAGEFSIELRDESGNTVRQISTDLFRVGEQEINIDLSHLREGVYFISLTDSQGNVQSVRFVKGGR